MRARTAIHPGEILADEREELRLSASELARQLAVPVIRIRQIIAGKRNVSADTALRLGRYFGTTSDFWMKLQMIYELDTARSELSAEIERLPSGSALLLQGGSSSSVVM